MDRDRGYCETCKGEFSHIENINEVKNLKYCDMCYKKVRKNKMQDDVYTIEGFYHITYKLIADDRPRTFKGTCENFNPGWNCAFKNEKNEMLIIPFTNIIEMIPMVTIRWSLND